MSKKEQIKAANKAVATFVDSVDQQVEILWLIIEDQKAKKEALELQSIRGI